MNLSLQILLIYLLFQNLQAYEANPNTCQCEDPQNFYATNLQKCIPKQLPNTHPSYIQNCLIHKYENAAVDKTVICQQCAQGYYTEDGQCKQHEIEHCIIADKPFSKILCLKCEQGYVPGTYVGKCVKEPIEGEKGYDSNCETYGEDVFGNIECFICQKTWRLSGINTCYQNTSNTFTGCVRWKKYIGKGTLCHECEQKDTMYPNHSEGVCKTAGEIGDASHIENCQNYTVDEEGLVHCDCIADHYKKIMKDGTTTCEPYPTQDAEDFIQNCDVYEFDTENEKLRCNTCGNSMRFDDNSNQCVENGVSNCMEWWWTQSNHICKQCRDGYVSLDRFQSCISCEIAINLPEPTPEPTDPQDSSNPTDSSNPEDPQNPTDPNDSTDPQDPQNPTDPNNSTNPEDPLNSTDPIDSSNPEDPQQPSDPIDSSDPQDPSNESDSNNSSNPEDPQNSTDPIDSSNPEDPQNPTEPNDSTDPSDSSNPSDPLDPQNPTDSNDSSDSQNSNEPTDSSNQSNPSDPTTDPSYPTDPSDPSSPTDPDVQDPQNPIGPSDDVQDPIDSTDSDSQNSTDNSDSSDAQSPKDSQQDQQNSNDSQGPSNPTLPIHPTDPTILEPIGNDPEQNEEDRTTRSQIIILSNTVFIFYVIQLLLFI